MDRAQTFDALWFGHRDTARSLYISGSGTEDGAEMDNYLSARQLRDRDDD